MSFSLANNIRATLRECSVPSIISTMFYLGFQNTYLRDVKCISGKDKIMVGPAFTVRTIPIREDNRAAILDKSMKNLQAEAFNEAESGQVLVCEASGVIETAFLLQRTKLHHQIPSTTRYRRRGPENQAGCTEAAEGERRVNFFAYEEKRKTNPRREGALGDEHRQNVSDRREAQAGEKRKALGRICE